MKPQGPTLQQQKYQCSELRCSASLLSVLLQSFLVAVVIPEKKELQSFAKQQGISGDYKDLLKNDKVTFAY